MLHSQHNTRLMVYNQIRGFTTQGALFVPPSATCKVPAIFSERKKRFLDKKTCFAGENRATGNSKDLSLVV
jgi:hypothetical protein